MTHVMILAHGGHVLMAVVPVAAVIYLTVALKGDAPKRKNTGTPVLPRNSFGRQVHHAMSPPKTKKPAAPPVPDRFAPPGKAPKKRRPGNVVPLHTAPPPEQGPDSGNLPSAWNQ